MQRFVSWLLVIIGLLVVAAVVHQCRYVGTANYQTATIPRGAVTQAVTATGTLNPVVNVQVGSQVSGTSCAWLDFFDVHPIFASDAIWF
jgi:HlyD family secretion protein